MNILIVSGAFYPKNTPRSFRTTELAKELSRRGHKVTVIIPRSDYDLTDFSEAEHIDFKYYCRPEGRHVFTKISLIDRAIFRFLLQFFAYPDIGLRRSLRNVIKDEKGYDLLITIAVPHEIHWELGRLYAKGVRVAKTWVADCGDSFMINKATNYKQPFYFKYVEKRWCKHCNYISVPLESEKENYYPEFVDKIRVIPQGFDFTILDNIPNEPHNEVPTFAFAGSFIPNLRDPRPILDYLCTSKRNFKIVFYTTQKNLISVYQSKLGCKLEIKEKIPREYLLKELRQYDFLLNIDNGKAKGRPSKLIDYALAGRPILSLNSSNLDTELLEEFLIGDYSRQFIIEDIEQFNIKNVAQQFLDLCK